MEEVSKLAKIIYICLFLVPLPFINWSIDLGKFLNNITKESFGNSSLDTHCRIKKASNSLFPKSENSLNFLLLDYRNEHMLLKCNYTTDI